MVWRKGDPTATCCGGRSRPDRSLAATPDTSTKCSDDYGNSGGGDLAYVGACDATSDTDAKRLGSQIYVTLWVDLEYGGGVDLGDWVDPCPNGCTVSALRRRPRHARRLRS